MKIFKIILADPAGVCLHRSVSARALAVSLFDILEANVLCSLATVDPRSRAHINIAYFTYSPEAELYFLSHPESGHCGNLLRNPSMAVTVCSSKQAWGKSDTGVQLFGSCAEVTKRELKRAEQTYGKRFQSYSRWKGSRTHEAGRDYRLYRFLPKTIRLLDEKRFGDGVLISASISRERPRH